MLTTCNVAPMGQWKPAFRLILFPFRITASLQGTLVATTLTSQGFFTAWAKTVILAALYIVPGASSLRLSSAADSGLMSYIVLFLYPMIAPSLQNCGLFSEGGR